MESEIPVISPFNAIATHHPSKALFSEKANKVKSLFVLRFSAMM
jgi:hypothetical protein